MKALLIIFLWSNAYAYTAQEYSTKIADLGGRHKLYTVKCGVDAPNKALIFKKMVDEDDSALMDCFTSKIVEVNSETVSARNQRDARRNAKIWHRDNVICSDETTPRKKAECRIFQR